MKKKVLAAVLSLSMILSTGVVAMADETKDPSEVKVGVITDGGVDIAPTTDNIDPEVLKKVDEVKEKIISGEIEVPTDKESFDAKYGDVYQLDD